MSADGRQIKNVAGVARAPTADACGDLWALDFFFFF